MAINLDSVFGLHETALKTSERRSELLASNLANADTPGYKARDIDFRAALAQASGNSGGAMRATHTRHIGTAGGADSDVLYRQPMQASVDGNTVDPQQEKGEFMQNALRYQASLRFIDGRIKAIKTAIKGQ